MDLVIFTKRCLSCTDKILWKTIKAFAKQHGLTIIEKRTNKSDLYREAAESYEIEQPFVVLGTTALSLKEPLERLL